MTTTTPAEAPSGEPPKWRWQDILANARETSAKEAEARVRQELEQKLKPYEGVDPTILNGYRIFNAAERGDQSARALIAQHNPQLAQAMGWVQAPAVDAEPEPDLQTADGQLVYSATRLKEWREWDHRRLEKKFDEKLKPYQQDREEAKSASERATYESSTNAALGALKGKYPEFDLKTHGPAIAKVIQADAALFQLALDPKTAHIAIRDAWREVYETTVLPSQQQQAKASVVADLQRQAVAGSISPNAPAGTTPQKFTPGVEGFQAALAHFGGS